MKIKIDSNTLKNLIYKKCFSSSCERNPHISSFHEKQCLVTTFSSHSRDRTGPRTRRTRDSAPWGTCHLPLGNSALNSFKTQAERAPHPIMTRETPRIWKHCHTWFSWTISSHNYIDKYIFSFVTLNGNKDDKKLSFIEGLSHARTTKHLPMCYLDNSSQPSEVYVIFYSKCYKQRKCALPWVTPLSNRACIMLVTVFFFLSLLCLFTLWASLHMFGKELIEMADLTGDGDIILNYLVAPPNHKSPYKGKKFRRNRVRWCKRPKEPLLALRVDGGLEPRNAGSLYKLEKAENRLSPTASGKNSALLIPVSLLRPSWDFWPSEL